MLNRIALLFFSLFTCLMTLHAKIHSFPVIIDTDASLDDMMAIVYLVQNPQTEIKGIVTVGEGMTHFEKGGTNILNVLKLIGHSRIPVYR